MMTVSEIYLQCSVLNNLVTFIYNIYTVVSIGFERNYSVDESVGMVNVCAVVTFPAPDVPILSTSILSVNTMEGTAGELGIHY